VQQLRQAGSDLCVVLNDQRIVLGVLRGHALLADPESRAEEVMDAGPVTYRPNVLVSEMAKHFEQTGAKRVLATTSDGELVGLLCHEDLHNGPVLASPAGTEVHTHG